MAKRIIDIGRIMKLINLGLRGSIIKYCDKKFSPENFIILISWVKILYIFIIIIEIIDFKIIIIINLFIQKYLWVNKTRIFINLSLYRKCKIVYS